MWQKELYFRQVRLVVMYENTSLEKWGEESGSLENCNIS